MLCIDINIHTYRYRYIHKKNKVSPRTQKQHLFLAVGMVEVDRRIRLAAVRHVLERYICRYESNPFNLTFLNISAHNEACLRQTLKHALYTTSVHPQLPPFPPGSSPSATHLPSNSCISAHNEACLRLTLRHASYTTSVHPQLTPFPPGSSPSATPSTSISWIFQPRTKHVWD